MFASIVLIDFFEISFPNFFYLNILVLVQPPTFLVLWVGSGTSSQVFIGIKFSLLPFSLYFLKSSYNYVSFCKSLLSPPFYFSCYTDYQLFFFPYAYMLCLMAALFYWCYWEILIVSLLLMYFGLHVYWLFSFFGYSAFVLCDHDDTMVMILQFYCCPAICWWWLTYFLV